jgi:hypothetical protein
MRKIALVLMMLGVIGLVALPCLAAEEKAAPAKPAPMAGKGPAAKMTAAKAPVVKLERIDIASYWGYNLDGILDKDGNLTAGRRGSPLVLSFVFAVDNQNSFRIMLDEIKFAVSFEDAEINTLAYYDDNFIPAKSIDYFRITGVFDALVVQGNPNVRTSKIREEKKLTQPELVKAWWEGIGDFNFPITVVGTATFVGPDGKNMIVPFEGTFPPKK